MTTGKCAYCGMQVQSGEKFCHSCGAANEFYKPEDEELFNQRYKLAKEQTETVNRSQASMLEEHMLLYQIRIARLAFQRTK